jgi:hypothetical protein
MSSEQRKINGELAKLMKKNPGYRLQFGFMPGGFTIMIQPYHGVAGGFGSMTAFTTRRANTAAILNHWDGTLAEIKEAMNSRKECPAVQAVAQPFRNRKQTGLGPG